MPNRFFDRDMIDFENLGTGDINKYNQSTTISWRDTFALRSFSIESADCTLVLASDAQIWLLRKPLKKVLSEFMKRMNISELPMMCFADYLNVATARPCVRGRFQLISSKGTTRMNNSTWVMAHHITGVGESDDHQVCITFNNDVQIKINESLTTFKKRQADADKISAFQASILRELQFVYGHDEYAKHWGEPDMMDFQVQYDRLQTDEFMEFFLTKMLQQLANRVYDKASSIPLDDKDIATLKKILKKRYLR